MATELSVNLIHDPYLLAVCVPIKMDRNGGRWCNELWAKDLALHLEYLTDLTLACPRVFAEPAATDRSLDVPPFDKLKFIDLPSSKNHLAAVASLPELAVKMWFGVKASSIVHAGFGGWPVSEGWLAIPIGRMQHKFVISYVESSFWRVYGDSQKLHRRVRSFWLERLNRACVRVANLRFFTSKAYEQDFLGAGLHATDNSHVMPATWIDEEILRDDADAARDWGLKSGNVRILFAGRLIADKGVGVLLEAMEIIADDVDMTLTIIGEGPLLDTCKIAQLRHQHRSAKIELLEPVSYGPRFFDLLRGVDAVIVPSISDEQPRLIFDAFSQCVPVLGSSTGGIREVVDNGVNGQIFDAGSSSALATRLRWAGQNRQALMGMGFAALSKARRFTHRSMHEARSKIISDALKERTGN